MNIQWYPGHMTKAKRMMQEDIKLIDLVIEIIDARIPISSRNPDIDELAKGKARMILLNKADLANPSVNKRWVDYYKKKGILCVQTDARSRNGFSAIMNSIDEAVKEKKERDLKRGILNRPVRTMVVGIPNVGKSTFINSLCKKAAAKTGNKPGVTKGKQWIKLNGGVELLDTPGILWPKFEDAKTGLKLAFIGSVNDEILNEEELSVELIKILVRDYKGLLFERFGIDEGMEPYVILEQIAGKRGCLKKGEAFDLLKAARIVLDEFRSGKLGKISLEEPWDE